MNISERIKKITGVQEHEMGNFRLLFLHSLFLGVFQVFFFGVASSVFVKTYDSSYLPYAYLVGGVLGFFASNLFGRLQQRISVKLLYSGTLLILGVLLVIFILLSIFQDFAPALSQAVPAIMFVVGTSMVTLAALEFGGLTTRLFDLRQGKRLLAYVGMGEVLAGIIGYLSLSSIIKLLGAPYMALFIAVAGIAMSLFILSIIIAKNSEQLAKKPQQKAVKTKSKGGAFGEVLNNKLYRMMALFSLLAFSTVYFADFGFLGTIKEKSYSMMTSEAQQQYIVQFFAIFFAISKSFELVMSFLSARLTRQFGMKLALLGLSVLMAGAVILGTIDLAIEQKVGTLFFLFMAFNKLFDRVIRKAFTIPSFRVLYQAVEPEKQSRIQAAIDGGFQQIGMIGGAIVLIAVNWMFVSKKTIQYNDGSTLEVESVDLFWFSLVFVPVLLGWIAVSLRLYRLYKQRLVEALSTDDGGDEEVAAFYGKQVVEQLDTNESRKIQEEIYPAAIMQELEAIGLTRNANETSRKDLIRCFVEADFLRTPVHQAIELEVNLDIELRKMLKSSKDPVTSQRIIEMLVLSGSQSTGKLLPQLLEDANIRVQFGAIRAFAHQEHRASEKDELIIKQRLRDYVGHLCWMIAVRADVELEEDATTLLQGLKEEEEMYLDHLFLLLSFLYDQHHIRSIRHQLLFTETDEGHDFALELLDTVVEDDIKAFLMPLFENVSNDQKRILFREIFPNRALSVEARLAEILVHNFARTGTWIKYCALKMISKRLQGKLPMEVRALVFHPHALLHEPVFELFFQEDPESAEVYLQKLTREHREELRKMFRPGASPFRKLYGKIEALRKTSLLSQTRGDVLVDLSQHFAVYRRGKKWPITVPQGPLVIVGVRKNRKEEEELEELPIWVQGHNLEENIEDLHEQLGFDEFLIASRKMVYNCVLDDVHQTEEFTHQLATL